MAVMHKTTFDLYQNDQNIVPKGYAAIDDMIVKSERLHHRILLFRASAGGMADADFQNGRRL